uniref:Uncharacterized protein n=1 Tax=Acrobeloides nanus TaxID=290746 RepID=A0A914D1L5_9BILA
MLLILGSFAAVPTIYYLIRRFMRRPKPFISPTEVEKLVNNEEINLEGIDITIKCLEKILQTMGSSKFQSEMDRNRYDLIYSVILRLKSVKSDLQRFRNDEATNVTDEIARQVWHDIRSPSLRAGTLSVLSDESFMSAMEDWPGSQPFEFEPSASFSIDFSQLNFYKEGFEKAQKDEVKYRKSRAEFCQCDSEMDFAAKLYCLRKAFTNMLEDEHTRQWLIQTGRILVADLMRHDKKDPADFFDAYDRMTQFLKEPSSYQIMAEELMQRNVAEINMWDVLLDFILLDSFDDLKKPPSAIVALLKNSFISKYMKESSLNSIIWSMLKAKRARLAYRDGFIAHFYDISQVVSPTLTMALLGGSLKNIENLCIDFKENIFAFVVEIFNLQRVRYTTLQELTEDVKNALEQRLETIQVKFSNELLPA